VARLVLRRVLSRRHVQLLRHDGIISVTRLATVFTSHHYSCCTAHLQILTPRHLAAILTVFELLQCLTFSNVGKSNHLRKSDSVGKFSPCFCTKLSGIDGLSLSVCADLVSIIICSIQLVNSIKFNTLCNLNALRCKRLVSDSQQH